MHVNFLWHDPADLPRVLGAIENLFRMLIGFGGAPFRDHGIGVLKAVFGLEQSHELSFVQERVKKVFDRRVLQNPGKIFPLRCVDAVHRN